MQASAGVSAVERPLTWADRRFLFVLGVPAFGLALAYTVVTTYLPVLVGELSGPLVTGLLLGTEGVLALVVPVLAGGWSDRSTSRLPVVLTGAAVMVAALVLMPAGAGSLAWLGVFVCVFFVGYFVYYTPYYALYPDLVRPEVRGRSQGFQGGLRSVGLLLALAAGGYLLSLWLALPFVVGAVAVVVATAGLFPALRRAGAGSRPPGGSGGFSVAGRMVRDDRAVRRWAIANACLEAAIGALRTFVVLYLTIGLGFSLGGASGALLLVGVSAVLAAPLAGKMADRFGPRRVMLVSVVVFALGLTVPVLTTSTALMTVVVVPVAFAAVVLMTLPYAILMTLMPESEHGAAAGLFGLSRGVGIIAGPLLAGLAVATLDEVRLLTFADTGGYSAIFAVAVVLLLASIRFLRRSAPAGPS